MDQHQGDGKKSNRRRRRGRGNEPRQGDAPSQPPQPPRAQPSARPERQHPSQPSRRPQGGPGNKNGRDRRNNQGFRGPKGKPQRQAPLTHERPLHAEGETFFVQNRPLRFAETWWADRWLSVLHEFGWKGRLANGRLYAREGRVVSFTVETGRIQARVQGTRLEPYEVTIALKPLPDADWDLVVDIMSCQALFSAQLLAGEMPTDVEEAFEAARAPLFPRTQEDITASCSCPDWANPCKHIAAVYYVMAEAFDKDPFLVFHLRGRSRDALIAMLRARRAAGALAMPMQVEAIDASSGESLRFWQAGEELEGVHVSITEPENGTGALARRLGRPPFWRSAADPITRLADVYAAIARRAREVALNEPTFTPDFAEV